MSTDDYSTGSLRRQFMSEDEERLGRILEAVSDRDRFVLVRIGEKEEYVAYLDGPRLYFGPRSDHQRVSPEWLTHELYRLMELGATFTQLDRFDWGAGSKPPRSL
ncbi:MAG: hypothetical protein ACYC5O_17550 [Anaerolineae bacterium]